MQHIDFLKAAIMEAFVAIDKGMVSKVFDSICIFLEMVIAAGNDYIEKQCNISLRQLLNEISILFTRSVQKNIQSDLLGLKISLSPPAKNDATPAKWFWQILMSQLLPTHKNFKTDSWCHSLFLKYLVQLSSA